MSDLSQMTSIMSAAVALDLAAGIWTDAEVFQNHDVDPLYGAALLKQEWFAAMVTEARREWSAISNAKERIRLKSQIAVEMGIPELHSVVVDTAVPAAARVAAFKELKDLSGAAAADPNSGGAVGPSVNIFLNDGGTPSVSVTANSRPDVEDAITIDVTPGNPDLNMLAPI